MKPQDPKDKKDEQAGEEAYQYEHSHGLPVDEAGWKRWEDVAKKAGLSQEQFKAVSDFGIADIKRMAQEPGIDRHHAETLAKKTLADPELSEDGKLKPEVKENMNAVFDRFGGEDGGKSLKASFNKSSLGNDPEMIKLFHRIGDGIKRAGGGVKNGKAPEQKTKRPIEDRLFDRKAK